MDPLTIMAIIAAAMPILTQLVTMAEQFAAQVVNANTPIAKMLAQVGADSHAQTMTDFVTALQKAVTTPAPAQPTA